MTRDWLFLDRYYSELLDDVYPQPDSDGHTELTRQVVQQWVSKLEGCRNVLDVGAGQGFAQVMFEELGIVYTGVSMGIDPAEAQKMRRNVLLVDFNFLTFPDGSFDLVFSRHSLEHSPMPLLTLMEWHRVAKHWLCLVLPSPKHYSWTCPNHYGIMSRALAAMLLDRAGWHVIWENVTEHEFWFMCEKKDRSLRDWKPFVLEEEKFELYEDKDEDRSDRSDA